MIRRRFLQLVTMAGAAGVVRVEAMSTVAVSTVIFHVKGFSCVTCATGLDTMLSQQQGVASSKSTYPEGKVTISFDPARTTGHAIVAFITSLGFTVEGAHQG